VEWVGELGRRSSVRNSPPEGFAAAVCLPFRPHPSRVARGGEVGREWEREREMQENDGGKESKKGEGGKKRTLTDGESRRLQRNNAVS